MYIFALSFTRPRGYMRETQSRARRTRLLSKKKFQPSRAEPSRAEPSRAEPSERARARAECGSLPCGRAAVRAARSYLRCGARSEHKQRKRERKELIIETTETERRRRSGALRAAHPLERTAPPARAARAARLHEEKRACMCTVRVFVCMSCACVCACERVCACVCRSRRSRLRTRWPVHVAMIAPCGRNLSVTRARVAKPPRLTSLRPAAPGCVPGVGPRQQLPFLLSFL